MNFNTLDLNLLVVFDAVMRTRSVTLAGERLGLSQPSTSNALQRLRGVFDDPLFVRTPKGMEPSALALELEGPIRLALDQLRMAVEKGQSFDPASAKRSFRILMSDIAQMVHMPRLIAMMRAAAPGIHIENRAMPLREAKQAMADGELDMAIGFLPDLGADFRRQFLFEETWVCMLSAAHPHIGASLSAQQYLAATHVSYRPAVAIHAVLDGLLESQFSDKGIRRSVGLVVPYISGLATTVAGSDLILTVPLGLADAMMSQGELRSQLRVLPLPFDLPRIDLNMQWHERVHRDPGCRWLRETFAQSYHAKERLALPRGQ